MSYNLRSRTLAEALRAQEESEDEDGFDGEGSEIEDNISSGGEESDYQNDTDPESDSDVEMASDLEDTSLEQRLLNSRARGRPTSKLRGKNGFEWSTNLRERVSGKFFVAYKNRKNKTWFLSFFIIFFLDFFCKKL